MCDRLLPPAPAQAIIAALDLEPLPVEGGFFAETYRSPLVLKGGSLPGGGEGARNLATAIYYLLAEGCVSLLHRLPCDEMYHFYGGTPLELLLLYPDGSGEVRHLGLDLSSGQRPQLLVPGGVWQGARLLHGGPYTLMGTTVWPGFDFSDFEAANREQLVEAYPPFASQIRDLTKP